MIYCMHGGSRDYRCSRTTSKSEFEVCRRSTDSARRRCSVRGWPSLIRSSAATTTRASVLSVSQLPRQRWSFAFFLLILLVNVLDHRRSLTVPNVRDDPYQRAAVRHVPEYPRHQKIRASDSLQRYAGTRNWAVVKSVVDYVTWLQGPWRRASADAGARLQSVLHLVIRMSAPKMWRRIAKQTSLGSA